LTEFRQHYNRISLIVVATIKGCILKNSFPSLGPLLLDYYRVGNLIMYKGTYTPTGYNTSVERFILLFYFCAANETFVIESIIIMRIHSYILKYVLTIGIHGTVFFIYFLLPVIVNNFRMGCNSDEGRCFTVAVCV